MEQLFETRKFDCSIKISNELCIVPKTIHISKILFSDKGMLLTLLLNNRLELVIFFFTDYFYAVKNPFICLALSQITSNNKH